ncbi:MAG TPA: ZIP family metal transporter [Acidobacteriaceae bacterium]|jgi:zinc and cadmium transporter|nr:ZIP family metal transporter [Acidobacteriaceae bacterium]
MHFVIVAHALLAVFALEAVAMLAAWLLRRRDYALSAFLPYLVSVATGLLLATALLHLLPEAIANLGNTPRVWYLLVAGILGLFCVEQIVAAIVHRGDTGVVHVHAHGHTHHSLRPANLIVASSLHSFLDGVSVAAAFAAGPRVGWITALAISLHEVPHRVGDFAVLLHAGYSATNALRMAVLPSLGALLGVALVAAFGASGGTAVYWLLPISAASFLYIACVNLLPELRHQHSRLAIALQMLCLFGGAALVALVAGLPGA